MCMYMYMFMHVTYTCTWGVTYLLFQGSKFRAFMLFDTMSRDGVEPDCQTYATMLILCAR